MHVWCTTGGTSGCLDAIECDDIRGDDATTTDPLRSGDVALGHIHKSGDPDYYEELIWIFDEDVDDDNCTAENDPWDCCTGSGTGDCEAADEVDPNLIFPDDQADCTNASEGAWILTDTKTMGRSEIPCVNFNDSNAVAYDINANICVQCTDTGDGSEDCDLMFSVQEAGIDISPGVDTPPAVNKIKIDADGDILLNDSVTVTGSVSASAGMDLGTSQALTGTTGMTIGDNSQTIAINSSDWDIDATGIITGVGSITSDGQIQGTGLTDGTATMTGGAITGLTTPLTVGQGGTGVATLNDAGLLVGAGAGNIEVLADGLTTQILVGGGADTNPAWGTDIPTAVTIGSAYIYRANGTDVPDADVANDITITNISQVQDITASAAEINTIDDCATTELFVGGGAGSAPVCTTATGTDSPVRSNKPTFDGVNAAGGSAIAVKLSGTLGIFDGSDNFRGLFLDYTNNNHTGTGNTVALLDIDNIAGDEETNTYAIRIGDMTGTTGSNGEVENAITIGDGWDSEIEITASIATIDHTGANNLTINSTNGYVGIEAVRFNSGNLTFVDSLDADGAVDMDYGSADITSHDFRCAGGAGCITVGNNASNVDYGMSFIADTNDLTILFDEDNAELEITCTGNEDIIFDLDTATDNEVGVSTANGVTQWNFNAISLVTTGTIQGAIKINTDADGMSQAEMTAVGMYGTMFFASGAGTWLLPDAVAGMSFCVYSTTAAAIVLDPDVNDDITLDGALLDNGDSITSASAAGDFICLIAQSNTHWFTLGRSGTWTDSS